MAEVIERTVGQCENSNHYKATETAGMITIVYIQSCLYMQFENRRMVAELFILEAGFTVCSDIFLFPLNVSFITFIPKLHCCYDKLAQPMRNV